MPHVTVHFQRLEVESLSANMGDEEEGTADDDHMISRVHFSIAVPGKLHTDLSVTVKQAAGSRFDDATLEIGQPKGYNGPFDWNAFRVCVARYYRSLLGGEGIVAIGAGKMSARMLNTRFEQDSYCSFDAQERSSGGF